MTVIADVFSKLWTPKSVVRSLCKNSCFGGHFEATSKSGPNTTEIGTAAPLAYFLITVNAI